MPEPRPDDPEPHARAGSRAVVDAVVVGGGPAGLAAATWLARYRRRVVVLDGEDYRNRWVEATHGYLGSDPVDPAELRKRALADLGAYESTEVRCTRATAVRKAGDVFAVETEDGTLEARRLVLATGVADVFPEVGRFFEHYGASVFHCPSCDGYEARDRRVVVFGWSRQIVDFALDLLEWAASVTVVTDGRPFEGDQDHRAELAAAGIEVVEDDAVELVGERGALEGVRLRRAGTVPADMAFFNIAHRPITDLAEQLGCALTDQGCIEVDEDGATSIPGVYAAGDVTPGMQVVQVAAAKGAIAGISCARSLAGAHRP